MNCFDKQKKKLSDFQTMLHSHKAILKKYQTFLRKKHDNVRVPIEDLKLWGNAGESRNLKQSALWTEYRTPPLVTIDPA